MIKQYLEHHYNRGRLHNCYLINTDSVENGFAELNEFIIDKLLYSDNAISQQEGVIPDLIGDPEKVDLILDSAEAEHDISHVDYICIRRLDNKTKNISIDQIRDMQKFLYKTSVISGLKVAVIYAADQMNINAANSCLKILEDTPANTYIFLITSNAASILPTIRSRCVKINHHYNLPQNKKTDFRFLSKKTSISEKLDFIAEFASKDRDLWAEFAVSIEELIAKFCYEASGLSTDLSEEELEIFSQFKSRSPRYLQIKYDQVRKIIDNTNIFDLDLRSSCLLLIDKFKS